MERQGTRGFLPTEDQGYLFVALQLPQSSSLKRTSTIVIGGMTAATLIAVLLVPVTYSFSERISQRFGPMQSANLDDKHPPEEPAPAEPSAGKPPVPTAPVPEAA